MVNDKEKEQKPLSEEMSFDEIRNCLSTASLAHDDKGNKYWMGITGRQHEIVRRLGFPNLYTAIPDWGSF